jgi:TRAP-type C4-dicarboxylate transport system permease small subunit
MVVVAETCVFGFFILLAWTGWIVLEVLEGDTLISLPMVSVQITQSVIPIGAALFIVCEALSLPDYWRNLRAGSGHELPPDPAAPGGSDP